MRYLAIAGAIAGWQLGGPWAAFAGLVIGQYAGNYMWGVACAFEDAELVSRGQPPKWAPILGKRRG